MLTQYGEYTIQGDVHPQTSHQLPQVTVQGMNSIGEKGAILALSMMIHC